MRPKQLLWASAALWLLSLITLGWAWHLSHDRTVQPRAGVALGKQINRGQSKVSVDKVTTSAGAKPFVAPAGFEYVIVTIKVQNTSGQPITVLPSTDTYIKTIDGKVSSLTPFTLDGPFRAGQILAGESTQGQLSYLVPKQTPRQFYVEASWSGGATAFSLTKEGN